MIAPPWSSASLGVAVLVALGRLAGAAAGVEDRDPRRIEARLAAAPVPLPAAPRPGADRYLRVARRGQRSSRASCTSTPRPRRAASATGSSRRSRSPTAAASCSTAASCRSRTKDAARPPGPIAVDGQRSLWPQETDRFTSAPDRDEEHLVRPRRAADGRGARHRAGDARSPRRATTPAAPMPLPVTVEHPERPPAATRSPGSALAAVWAVMTGYLLWRIKRRID